MLGLASDGILAFSTLPLRAITWLGLGVTGYALAMGLYLVWTHLIGQRSLAWDSTSLATLILLLAGAQFLTLGVLGQYMGRIYSEVRHRPLYLVRERRGFEDPT
jgi:dolichol-phosphate mannosyltransferase